MAGKADGNVFDDLVKQGEAKFRSGNLQGAYDDARHVLGRARDNGRAHFLMSCIATAKEAHQDALKLCQIALGLDGASGEYLAQLATCHFHLGALSEAREVAMEALECDAAPADALDKLKDIFHAVEDYPHYLQVAERLCALAPDDDASLVQLGAAHFLCGRIGEARQAVEAAIRRNPKNPRAYCVLTDLRSARPDDNVAEVIAGLIAETPTSKDKIALHYALARECDGLDQIGHAFESLKQGKKIVRDATGYSVQPDIAMFAALRRYVETAPPAAADASAATPIFVVGMPRSGTTVTERILTNCDGVTSIGESLQFGALVRRYAQCTSPRLIEARTVDLRWRGLPLGAIGKAYVDFGTALAHGAPRFVNKLPLNLLYAPLILRALPNARMICLRRHPLDTVLGNYRQLLGMESPTYGYSCSLTATATFVAESMKLADMLAARHPGQFRLLDYEGLVTDLATKAREIVEFCGLAWTDRAVAIESNASAVGTASAAQVQVPIHTRYIGRWRRYKDHLGEAIAVLKSYGLASDADA